LEQLAGTDAEGLTLLKHRTYPRQARHPADPFNSAPGVTIAGSGSHVRSVSHKALYAASILFLLQSISALSIIDRSIYGEWAGKGGNKITFILNLLGIFTSLFLFWSGTRETRKAPFNRVLPLLAAGFLLISVLWSVDPRVTLSQGTIYLAAVLGAIGIVQALDSNELMDLAASICGLSAVASIVQFVIFPEPGDFRGIFSQKNLLGEAMAVGVLAALHGTRITRKFRYFCIIMLCSIVALMSKSATSVLTIIVFLWLDILGRLYLRGGSTRTLSTCLAIVSVPIAIFVVMNEDLILDLFGKDRSLSGRTYIWTYAIDAIGERPILGWGFCAFWSSLNSVARQIAQEIAARHDTWFVWTIPEAHNGMLEFLLEIGFAGTLLFTIIWIRNLAMALKCMAGPARQFGLSSILLLLGILVNGVSEEVLLGAGQVWTSFFFVMGLICEQKLWRPVLRSSLLSEGRSESAVSAARLSST